MLTLLLTIFAAVTFGVIGTVTGLVIGQRTVPDLRATDAATADLLWARAVVIMVTVTVLTLCGTLGFWLTGRVITNMEHPALTTCQDYVLPPAALYKAVQADADPNQASVRSTYTVCRITQK